MSIPQICPSCGEHISGPHTKDCCFGAPEYAHIGWPEMSPAMTNFPNIAQRVNNEDSAGILTMGEDTASAIRRLLDYLNDEPEATPEVKNPYEEARLVLAKHATKLRKEADGISLAESRAKRLFAANVLDDIIEEMQQ